MRAEFVDDFHYHFKYNFYIKKEILFLSLLFSSRPFFVSVFLGIAVVFGCFFVFHGNFGCFFFAGDLVT